MTRPKFPFRFTFAIFLIAISTGAASADTVKSLKRKAASRAEQVQGPLYATRPEVMAFADDLASRRNLDPMALRESTPLWIGPPPTHSNAPPPLELEQMVAIATKFDVAARRAKQGLGQGW